MSVSLWTSCGGERFVCGSVLLGEVFGVELPVSLYSLFFVSLFHS